jgi:hypothetical protein
MPEYVCEECGAPAEVTWTSTLTGVDFDGKEAVFEWLKIKCAAGHWYNEIGSVVGYE